MKCFTMGAEKVDISCIFRQFYFSFPTITFFIEGNIFPIIIWKKFHKTGNTSISITVDYPPNPVTLLFLTLFKRNKNFQKIFILTLKINYLLCFLNRLNIRYNLVVFRVLCVVPECIFIFENRD